MVVFVSFGQRSGIAAAEELKTSDNKFNELEAVYDKLEEYRKYVHSKGAAILRSSVPNCNMHCTLSYIPESIPIPQ